MAPAADNQYYRRASFLISAGKHLPVYRWLYDSVPGFGQLRNPTRIFWCTEIAVACLGAVGIDRMLRRAISDRRRRLLGCVGIVSGLIVLGALA